MNEDNLAINVRHIHKTFKLPHERHGSVKSALISRFSSGKRTFEKQKVLNDINFEVKKGEFFGVLGRNGSGKSTLLKLMAGIYYPTSGNIQINGKLTPFIELGVGFNPELTGRENVFLNGALLGFSRAEMAEMYDEIVEFAELERFMDQKLKNYSSGMQVRLAFSIAIRAKSDILLIDEVLAVGDYNFQAKCLAVFEQLKKDGVTIVFISHDMESVRRFCDSAILIEKGKIIAHGSTQNVIDGYMKLNAKKEKLSNATPYGMDDAQKETGKIKITSSKILNDKLTPAEEIDSDIYILEMSIKALDDCNDYIPGVVLRNQNGIRVTASNTIWSNHALPPLKKGQSLTIRFKFSNVLERGIYYLSSNVVSGETKAFYDWDNDADTVFIQKDFETGGIVNPAYEVEYKEADA
jgi:ABC-2 type transport system ATP-binding protein